MCLLNSFIGLVVSMVVVAGCGGDGGGGEADTGVDNPWDSGMDIVSEVPPPDATNDVQSDGADPDVAGDAAGDRASDVAVDATSDVADGTWRDITRDGRDGPDGRLCDMVACLRPFECVRMCGGPVLYSGCCPCEEGTIDRVTECNDGGRRDGGLPDGAECGDGLGQCADGLSCCYPCGIPGCANVCEPSCTRGDPGCFDGCLLRP